jgi:outer membrane protein OmpA-like peptidoglycan-associated protein
MKSIKLNSALTWGLSSVALVGLVSFSNPVWGQESNVNLVKNGSFETPSKGGKLPKKLGGINFCEFWNSPTGVKADFYSSDVKDVETGISVPQSKYGKEEPTYGKNYAGIHVYLTGKKQQERSYLTGELSTPLKKKKLYCVEYYVSLAEGSKYATNNIGAKFDKKVEFKPDKIPFPGVADILHPDNESKIFNSANGWHKICGTYEAKGGEQFITIGNFAANNKTKNEPFKKSKNAKATALQSAYYFIDNVSVRDYYPTFESYLLAKSKVDLIKNEDDLTEDQINEKKDFEKEYLAIEPCKCGGKDMDKGYSNLTYQKDFIIEEKMTPKEKIETYAVFFAAGKSELTTEANNTIDEVARILKANSGLTLTVVGHADTMETNLSEITPAFKEIDKKRATAVADQLKKLGVTKAIAIEFKGIKEESDSASGDEEEKEIDWAKNRRVQFIIK